MSDLKTILADAEQMYRRAAAINPCGGPEDSYRKALRQPLCDLSVKELNRRADLCKQLLEVE